MDETVRRRLDSWKDIADYLGRDTRTALRWERERGLPVHRVPGGRRTAVFAYTTEIDHWLSGEALEPSRPARPPEAGAPASGPASAPQGEALASDAPARLGRVARRPLGLGAGILLVAAAAVGLALWSGAFRPRERVLRVVAEGNQVVAIGSTGAALWSSTIANARAATQLGSVSHAVRDFDGDGRDEIVVSATVNDPSSTDAYRGEINAYTEGGRSIWHREWERSVTFGDVDYGPPWASGQVMGFGPPGRGRVAWTVRQSTWWPAAVLTLDGRGAVTGEFVNAGWIDSLNLVERPGAPPMLLVAGVNNAFNCGMLAVLDGDRVSGSSPPPPDAAFTCRDCPPGRPLRYLLFPRSELNAMSGAAMNAAHVRVSGGIIYARTVEVVVGRGTEFEQRGEAIYEFSTDFRLLRASFSDDYWDLHRRLEAEGRVTHTAANCPERTPHGPIRSWNPERGWTELRVGPPVESR